MNSRWGQCQLTQLIFTLTRANLYITRKIESLILTCYIFNYVSSFIRFHIFISSHKTIQPWAYTILHGSCEQNMLDFISCSANTTEQMGARLPFLFYFVLFLSLKRTHSSALHLSLTSYATVGSGCHTIGSSWVITQWKMTIFLEGFGMI